MESFEGTVKRITYQNAENAYVVFCVEYEGEEMTCTGTIPGLEKGMRLELTGDMVHHAKFGDQFKVESYKELQITDVETMKRYLSSGAVKGVGEVMAERIIKKFGEDTFRIIEEEPERLAEIKGISEKKAREIAVVFYEKREMREAMVFLEGYHISGNIAVKIFERYGREMYNILRNNPYKIANDIDGVGFKTADAIAMKMGFSPANRNRIRALVQYVIQNASQNGHIYLPKDVLLRETLRYAEVDEVQIELAIEELVSDREVIVKSYEKDGVTVERLYSSMMYYMELNISRMLLDIDGSFGIMPEVIEKKVKKIEGKMIRESEGNFSLGDEQRQAVIEAVNRGIFILTGGPGTGKTTTIKTMIELFEDEGMDVLLAAPTGRAAKRMTEATGRESRTIHRLLEFSGSPQNDGTTKGFAFGRNHDCPLEADAIIIDEMSMVDMFLFDALLKAVTPGTRLILVGDSNQLPSVGAGNILHDILAAQTFHSVALSTIFRQAAKSDIVQNAHRIKRGEPVVIKKDSKDFFFLQREDISLIPSVVVYLVKDKISKYLGVDPLEIQVLTPMKQGELGVNVLNEVLQEALNPADPSKTQKELPAGGYFRTGDKVMQIRNNYRIEWEVRNKYGQVTETGAGVFNGDCGIVSEISHYGEYMIVQFDEGKYVKYGFSELDDLTLAYAVTVHKSQGSEYPAVIMPVHSGPHMLFNRNVLYTAVTRAKRCVVAVGLRDTLDRMIANVSEQRRYTSLSERICEMVYQRDEGHNY